MCSYKPADSKPKLLSQSSCRVSVDGACGLGRRRGRNGGDTGRDKKESLMDICMYVCSNDMNQILSLPYTHARTHTHTQTQTQTHLQSIYTHTHTHTHTHTLLALPIVCCWGCKSSREVFHWFPWQHLPPRERCLAHTMSYHWTQGSAAGGTQEGTKQCQPEQDYLETVQISQ